MSYRPSIAALQLAGARGYAAASQRSRQELPSAACALHRRSTRPLVAAPPPHTSWRLAAAAPPASRPPSSGSNRSPGEQQADLQREAQQLCLEAATAATLPPAEEAALLGTPPGMGADLAHAELELELLIKDLATAATLPPAEEAALLGTPPGVGAAALAAEAAPPVIDEASLPQPLAILRCKPEGHPEETETVFYILGTAHISQQSCLDVSRLVRTVHPQFVFLELCKERAAMLAEGVRPRPPTVAEVAALVRAGKATPFAVVYSWLLARVGQGMDLVPGAEFRVALQEAQAVGAKYVLGDRQISITMARVWAALSGWEKARLLGSLLMMGARKVDRQAMQNEIEQLKQPDALSAAVDQFGKDFPSIVKPLVTERDQYMVYVLRKLALYGDRVVAVVGAGHLKGIREHWDDDIDLEELTRRPGK